VSEPIKFGSGWLGNKLTIYHNRIEIVSGCAPFARKRVIPFSAISSIETPRMLNQVVIHTHDGKKASYSVGNTSKIRDAILERM